MMMMGLMGMGGGMRFLNLSWSLVGILRWWVCERAVGLWLEARGD